MSDWNANIIDEFRANDGVMGGGFEGWTLLLLHHTGAKTGTERVSPLAYQARGDSWAIFASKAGATTHPDWFHNLKAKPDTSIEVGAQKVAVTARIAEGAEHTEIWAKQKADRPQFAEYEAKAGRTIPVIILDPS